MDDKDLRERVEALESRVAKLEGRRPPLTLRINGDLARVSRIDKWDWYSYSFGTESAARRFIAEHAELELRSSEPRPGLFGWWRVEARKLVESDQ